MEIREIIKAGGGPSKVGAAVGRAHSSVIAWTRVPAEHVRVVSRITGIPPHQLRPDLFDPPAAAAASEAAA